MTLNEMTAIFGFVFIFGLVVLALKGLGFPGKPLDE